ncbi:fasciclin-like arabinogalactan protein 19 [Tasmannia lanceolata]|uniref:fasciclin-like arabinogalactan protein 19 n=1 Tax=Tasmannia lanceolata TaxID=3420 RepID=UPI0040632BF6
MPIFSCVKPVNIQTRQRNRRSIPALFLAFFFSAFMATKVFFPISVHLLSLSSLIVLLLFHSLLNVVNGISDLEIQSMLSAFRSRGYNLFGNAIMTSDLRYQILDGSSFTFFAPSDSALFALDMTVTASEYVQTLRYHVALHRFTISTLHTLPSGIFLRSLLPRHDIYVQQPAGVPILLPESRFLTAAGIDIIVPDLYLSPNIAVHGLDGIFRIRAQIGVRKMGPPPRNESFPPRSTDWEDHEHLVPSPEFHQQLAGISPGSAPESPLASSPGVAGNISGDYSSPMITPAPVDGFMSITPSPDSYTTQPELTHVNYGESELESRPDVGFSGGYPVRKLAGKIFPMSVSSWEDDEGKWNAETTGRCLTADTWKFRSTSAVHQEFVVTSSNSFAFSVS